MKRLIAVVALWLAACVSHGPQSFTLTPPQIEQQIQADLGTLSDLFNGAVAARPVVAMMPTSERVGVAWNVTMPEGALGSGTAIIIQISGKPALNPAHTGIDLTEVRFEDVRVPGFLGLLSLSRFTDLKSNQQPLPDLPLVALPKSRLTQERVAYGATGVAVGYGGLRVDIAPK
jgi:hypothetical protein